MKRIDLVVFFFLSGISEQSAFVVPRLGSFRKHRILFNNNDDDDAIKVDETSDSQQPKRLIVSEEVAAKINYDKNLVDATNQVDDESNGNDEKNSPRSLMDVRNTVNTEGLTRSSKSTSKNTSESNKITAPNTDSNDDSSDVATNDPHATDVSPKPNAILVTTETNKPKAATDDQPDQVQKPSESSTEDNSSVVPDSVELMNADSKEGKSTFPTSQFGGLPSISKDSPKEDPSSVSNSVVNSNFSGRKGPISAFPQGDIMKNPSQEDKGEKEDEKASAGAADSKMPSFTASTSASSPSFQNLPNNQISSVGSPFAGNSMMKPPFPPTFSGSLSQNKTQTIFEKADDDDSNPSGKSSMFGGGSIPANFAGSTMSQNNTTIPKFRSSATINADDANPPTKSQMSTGGSLKPPFGVGSIPASDFAGSLSQNKTVPKFRSSATINADDANPPTKSQMSTVGSLKPPFGVGSIPASDFAGSLSQNKTVPKFGAVIPASDFASSLSQNKTIPKFGAAVPASDFASSLSQNKTVPKFGAAIPASDFASSLPHNKTIPKFGAGINDANPTAMKAQMPTGGSPFSNVGRDSFPGFKSPLNTSQNKTSPKFGDDDNSSINDNDAIPSTTNQMQMPTAGNPFHGSPVKSQFGNVGGSSIPSFTSTTNLSQNKTSPKDGGYPPVQSQQGTSPFTSRIGGGSIPPVIPMQNKTSPKIDTTNDDNDAEPSATSQTIAAGIPPFPSPINPLQNKAATQINTANDENDAEPRTKSQTPGGGSIPPFTSPVNPLQKKTAPKIDTANDDDDDVAEPSGSSQIPAAGSGGSKIRSFANPSQHMTPPKIGDSNNDDAEPSATSQMAGSPFQAGGLTPPFGKNMGSIPSFTRPTASFASPSQIKTSPQIGNANNDDAGPSATSQMEEEGSPFQAGGLTPPFGKSMGSIPSFTRPTGLSSGGGKIPSFASPSQNKTSPQIGNANNDDAGPSATSQMAEEGSPFQAGGLTPPFGKSMGSIPSFTRPTGLSEKKTPKLGADDDDANVDPPPKSHVPPGSPFKEVSFPNAGGGSTPSFASFTGLSQNKTIPKLGAGDDGVGTTPEKIIEESQKHKAGSPFQGGSRNGPFGNNVGGGGIPSFKSPTALSQNKPSPKFGATGDGTETPEQSVRQGQIPTAGAPFTSPTSLSKNKTVPKFGAGDDEAETSQENSIKKGQLPIAGAPFQTVSIDGNVIGNGPTLSSKMTPTTPSQDETTKTGATDGSVDVQKTVSPLSTGSFPAEKSQSTLKGWGDRVDGDDVSKSAQEVGAADLFQDAIGDGGLAGDNLGEKTSVIPELPKGLPTNQVPAKLAGSTSEDPETNLSTYGSPDVATESPPLGWTKVPPGTSDGKLVSPALPSEDLAGKNTGDHEIAAPLSSSIENWGESPTSTFPAPESGLSTQAVGDELLPSPPTTHSAALTNLPLSRETKTRAEDYGISQDVVDAYIEWCSVWGKTFDPARLPIFKHSLLQHYSIGRTELDAYADLSPEETAIAKEEAHLKAIRISQEFARERQEAEERARQEAEEYERRGREAAKRLIEETNREKLEADARLREKRDATRTFLKNDWYAGGEQRPSLMWDHQDFASNRSMERQERVRIDLHAREQARRERELAQREQEEANRLRGIEEARRLNEEAAQARQLQEDDIHRTERYTGWTVEDSGVGIEGDQVPNLLFDEDAGRRSRQLQEDARQRTERYTGLSYQDSGLGIGGDQVPNLLFNDDTRSRQQQEDAIQRADGYIGLSNQDFVGIGGDQVPNLLFDEDSTRARQKTERYTGLSYQDSVGIGGDQVPNLLFNEEGESAMMHDDARQRRGIDEGLILQNSIGFGGDQVPNLLWDADFASRRGVERAELQALAQAKRKRELAKMKEEEENRLRGIEEARRLNEEVARSRQVVERSKEILKAQGEMEARQRAAEVIKFAAKDRNLKEQDTRDVGANRERAQEAILRSAQQRNMSQAPAESTRRRFGVESATGEDIFNAPELRGPDSLASKGERLKALLKAGKQAQLEGWDSSSGADFDSGMMPGSTPNNQITQPTQAQSTNQSNDPLFQNPIPSSTQAQNFQSNIPPLGQPTPGNPPALNNSPALNNFSSSIPPQPQGIANPHGTSSNPSPNTTAGSLGSESMAEKGGRLRALLKAGKEAQQKGWDNSSDQFDSSMMAPSPPQNPQTQPPEE